jgi:hypothetical protein
MISLAPILEQLDGRIQGIAHVRGLRNLAALQSTGGAMPAVYVGPESETASPSRLVTNAHHQQIDCIFFVVLVVGASTSNMAAEVDQIKSFSDAIEEKLIGWVHPDSGANNVQTEYLGGRLLSVSTGQVQWLMRFKTTRTFRKVKT